MPISEYITNDILLQPLSQKVAGLQELFDELTCSHIPIGEGKNYIGCVSEADVRCFESEKSLQEYRYALVPFYTRPDVPLLETLKTFTVNHTNILPILNQANDYLGYFELNDILSLLNEAPFFSEEGNIIVVEKKVAHLSFSEIAQIIESNQSKVYGFYISHASEGKVQITIKTGQVHLNEILQTFRRYEYTIISEHQEDSFRQNLEERSAYLQKYLNI